MTPLIIAIHLIACILMILVILMQSGKGASMGAAFGGSNQTLFGSSGGSTFFNKLTTSIAVIFMLTSLTLAYISANSSKVSVMSDVKKEVTATDVPGHIETSPQNNSSEQKSD